MISKLTKHLGSLVGKRIALLGLAFKPNTDDMREASSLVLAARLQGEGARWSPTTRSPRAGGRAAADVDVADTAAEALEGADAAILVTEWPEFAELDWEELARRMANPLIVDGRNFLDPASRQPASPTRESAAASTAAAPGGGLMQAVGPRRGRGNAAAPAHPDAAEARAGARRPPVHPLHGRLARPPRGRRGGDGLRVSRPRTCARRSATRSPGALDPLRRGGRAAGHRRAGASRRRPGPARRALHGPQRRRAHRPRPDRASAPARGDRRGDHAGPLPGRRPDLLRARAPRRRGEVLGFLEKPEPEQIDTDEISAAPTWSSAGLDLIPPGRAVSIEREVFPRLVGQGLFGRRLEGYWMDIGTPERYLQASWDILEGACETTSTGDGGRTSTTMPRSPRTRRSSRAPWFRCRSVGGGATIAESVLLDGCRTAPMRRVRGAILARSSRSARGDDRAGSVIGRAPRSRRARWSGRARVQPEVSRRR